VNVLHISLIKPMLYGEAPDILAFIYLPVWGYEGVF